MSIADSNMLFSDLPMHIQDKFQAIAYKSDAGQTARQFFHTEIPDVSKADPEAVQLLLDGGTVQIPVDVYHQGAGGVQTELVDYTVPNHDFSRVVSGENGGDYTSENVVLEEDTLNFSRQGSDMTEVEYESATESLQSHAEVLSNRLTDTADGLIAEIPGTTPDVVIPSGTVYTTTPGGVPHVTDVPMEVPVLHSGPTAPMSDVITATETTGESVLETAFESVLPLTMGVKGAHAAWESNKHLPTEERVAVAALGGGAATLGTYALLAIPGVNILVAGYGIYQLGKLGHAGYKHVTKNA